MSSAEPAGGEKLRLAVDNVVVRSGLGRYAVEARMGLLLRARDLELDRPVVLKLLGSELRCEARALAALSHPNVVAVYDAGRIEGQFFLAMELVDGPTLSQWARAGRRSIAEISAALLGAARGLVAARAAGILRHDFANHQVLIGADGRARVTFS